MALAISRAVVAAFVMGGMLFTIFAAIVFGRNWRRGGVTNYNPVTGWRRLEPGQRLPETSVLDRLNGRPLSGAFLGLAIGVVLGGAAFAAALVFAADVASLAETVAIAGIGFMVAVYLLAGVYVSVRSRGHGSAGATAALGLTLGILLLIAVSAQLLIG